jgi:hypothetical protein
LLNRVAPAVVLVCAALAGCGGEDPPAEPDQPPAALLEEALSTPIESGEISIDLHAPEGAVELDGPFELRGAAVPRFDLEFEAEVAGYGVDGELISDGEDGYVVFFGENYRLGTDHIDNADRRIEQAVASGLEVDPADWIAEPRYDGTEEVGGEHCHRIAGGLRIAPLRADLEELSATLDLNSPGELAEELNTGAATFLVQDGAPLLCGFSLDAELEGGELDLDVRFSDLGEAQEIERPPGGGFDAVEELLARFERIAGVRIDF